MDENLFIEKIDIDSYEKLVKTIKGKTSKCDDLRNKFIFRGVEDSTFKLIPSALRGSKLNGYVNEDFKLTLRVLKEEALEYGFEVNDESADEYASIPINKYFEKIDDESSELIFSKSEFQFRKELDALLNFLNYADKVGLKIPAEQDIRKLMERNIGKTFDYKTLWPKSDFYETISLAQHYGVPTRALDWSYDYNVALYFALKNILDDDYLNAEKTPSEGVLWAYDYRYFERNHYYHGDEIFPIQYYRPEYNTNPNLNAQKGLFTFIVDRIGEISDKSFNKFITDNLLNKSHDFEKFRNSNQTDILDDEKIFYKFLISEEAKPNILNELYLEGYSEEYLFPGYNGVVLAIENKIKLDQIRKKRFYSSKNGLVISNKI